MSSPKWPFQSPFAEIWRACPKSVIVSCIEVLLGSYLLKKRGMRTLDRVAGVEPKLAGPACWRGAEMWGFMILDPVFRSRKSSLGTYTMQSGCCTCIALEVSDASDPVMSSRSRVYIMAFMSWMEFFYRDLPRYIHTCMYVLVSNWHSSPYNILSSYSVVAL